MKKKDKDSTLAMALGIAALGLGGHSGLGNPGLGLPPIPRERPMRKCLLPGCDAETNHRGGYCCREHCAQHREVAS
jgi:hypothetical protein